MSTLHGWLERRAEALAGGAGPLLLEDARREIDGFVGPPTVRALEDAVARSSDVRRYRVVGRALYRERRDGPDKSWFAAAEERFGGMVGRLLDRIPSEVAVPDFEFAVNLGDYPVRDAPILTAWSRKGFGNARIPSVVHWPTDLAVSLDDPSIRAHYAFTRESVDRPWSERTPRVAWRGSATGMYERTFRWAWVPRLLGIPPGKGLSRLDLCRISEAHPDVVDARITGWPQISDRLRTRLEADYPTAPRVPNSWFLEHQLVANVDGNVATTSFLTFVGSGSVVLKQASPYLDWCAHHLEERRHYLPVRRDLGDLVDVARTALTSVERSEEIVRLGRAFASRFLTGAAIDFYVLALFERYAAAARDSGVQLSEAGRAFERVG